VAEVRAGLGFDVHPASEDADRPMFLGGVRFTEARGLAGHSDADVVCHALADAMLGAAALGDLGQHFPEDDPAYEGAAGLDLLARAVTLVGDAGYRTSSCDLTVVAAAPAIGPRREDIRARLAGVLGVESTHVSVKATRPEGLGLSGDGAACMAVVLLERA
jgi:2-C-methyl-D-erythritol 2,4-cyclodiphosphate synthase